MKKIPSLALALLASLSLTASVSADETKKNLLANGGFEQDGIRYPNDDVANVRRAAKFGRNDGIGLRLICNEKTHKILTYLKVSSPLEADKTPGGLLGLCRRSCLADCLCGKLQQGQTHEVSRRLLHHQTDKPD